MYDAYDIQADSDVIKIAMLIEHTSKIINPVHISKKNKGYLSTRLSRYAAARGC
jgi:hypothetical protein